MENMPDNVKDNPVGKREALLADRLRLHKGYRYTEVEIFSKGDFTLGTNWFEGEVTVGDVAESMCMADADIEFIGEDNVPSASYTYVVTGAYDNFGGKEILGAEEYLSRINIKVYEGDENGNLVFEGGAAECLAWADGYCGHC